MRPGPEPACGVKLLALLLAVGFSPLSLSAEPTTEPPAAAAKAVENAPAPTSQTASGGEGEEEDWRKVVHGKNIATSSEADRDRLREEAVTPMGLLSRAFVATVIVVATILGVFAWFRRSGRLKFSQLLNPDGQPSHLVVSETRSLGNKQYLMVIEYDARRILIGVSPNNVQHICFLDTPFDEEIEESGMSEDIARA